jgi:hypothetical protein
MLWSTHTFLSVYFLHLGFSSLKSGAFPPPNVAVPFRQPIVRNKKARIAAMGVFAMSGAMAVQPFIWESVISKPTEMHYEQKQIKAELKSTEERIKEIKEKIESER